MLSRIGMGFDLKFSPVAIVRDHKVQIIGLKLSKLL